MRDAPPILFLVAPKRECAAPGGREKALRRVGPHQCGPPAAGGGWLAVPCGGQGRKRSALGETFSPGKFGIHAASLFAAAGRWLMRVSTWANATAPTIARAARSDCAAVGGFAAYGCGVPLAGKRNARKEKLLKCVLAPRRPPHPPPRDGSIDLAEDPSVPEGRAKSEQAPIRRPPSRGGPLHRSAPKAIFSLGPSTARSLFVKNKKRMGGGMSQLASQLNRPGGRLPPLRHHRADRINTLCGSAVPTAVCCSPECGHSRPPRRSP